MRNALSAAGTLGRLVFACLCWAGVCAPVCHAADDALLARLISRGGKIRLEARSYQLERPLNLRGAENVVIEGVGPSTVLLSQFNAESAERWPIVDMVGAMDCCLEDVHIRNNHRTKTPACGVLLGRTSPASSANILFDNVHVTGSFRVANVVNIGGELDTWNNPKLVNAQPGGQNYVSAGWFPEPWRARVCSPYGDLWAGRRWDGPDYSANGLHTFLGGSFGVYGHSGTEVNVWMLPGAHMATFTGTFFSNKATDRAKPETGGLAAIRVGMPGVKVKTYPKNHDGLTFLNCWFETNGARYTFLVHDDAEINIIGGRLEALENCLQVQGQLVQVRWSLSGVDAQGGYARYSWEHR